MTQDDWLLIRHILEEASELPMHRRRAFVRTTSPNDRIREVVEKYLSREPAIDQFDECGSDTLPSIDTAELIPEIPEQSVGPYRLLSRIGSGGMGVVYLAERSDGQFERRVAIKFLSSPHARRGLVRRFHDERRALARLNHPNIAILLDGGTTPSGLPYLVMEHVEGVPIDRYCDEKELGIEDRLRLMVNLCRGVHHAHQHLIVHRDLKPGNILVTEGGTPKILDFGIAKLLADDGDGGAAGVEMTTVMAITPKYSSPEHLQCQPMTTVSDVYSLGVVLYELLTGRHPHAEHVENTFDFLRNVCHTSPVAVSQAVPDRQVSKRLAGDLDNIVRKAMHVDPHRRYSSAEAFAHDIEHHLQGEPVSARRDTVFYRVTKFVQRNRGLSVASGTAIVAMVMGIVLTMGAMFDAREAQRDAEEISEFLRSTLTTANPYRLARRVGIHDLLENASERIDAELSDKPRVEAAARLAVGKAYAGLWQWGPAVKHLRRSLALMREHDPDNQLAIAECLSIMGRGMTFARSGESVALQKEGLAIRRRELGPTHPLVAESLGNLGYAYWQGVSDHEYSVWELGATNYSAAIDILRKQFNQLSPQSKRDLARITFSFGVMRTAQGLPDEAEPLFLEALELYRDIGGSGDRYMVACMERYGWLLHRTGRLDEAVKLIQQAIDNTPADLYHETVINNTWRLADIRYRQGDSHEALQMVTRALGLGCRRMGQADEEGSSQFVTLAYELIRDDQGIADGDTILVAMKQLANRMPNRGKLWERRAKLIAAIARECELDDLVRSVEEFIVKNPSDAH